MDAFIIILVFAIGLGLGWLQGYSVARNDTPAKKENRALRRALSQALEDEEHYKRVATDKDAVIKRQRNALITASEQIVILTEQNRELKAGERKRQ